MQSSMHLKKVGWFLICSIFLKVYIYSNVFRDFYVILHT